MSAEAAFDLAEEIQRQIERHRETNWVELDPEIRAFAISFITTPVPRKAAEEAGISPARGARMFRDPIARAYISHLQDLQAENSIINTQFVQATILHYIQVFAGEESAPTVVPGIGICDEKRIYPAELVRLIDMMAKNSGFYNADLSQNSVMQFIQMLQETGRKHQLESEPVDPASFRLVQSPEENREPAP